MSTKNKNGAKSGSSGREARGNANSNKNDNRPKVTTVARNGIVSSAQWTLMFCQLLMNVPRKGGQLAAHTVQDILDMMTSLAIFVVDPNLAIDTFRELKDLSDKKGLTDAYGRGFGFTAFRTFLTQHPKLDFGKADRDLSADLFAKHSRPRINAACTAAFEAGVESYNKGFLHFLAQQNLTLKAFQGMGEAVQEGIVKGYNPDFAAGDQFAHWLDKTHDFITKSKGKPVKLTITKGTVLTKTRFRKVFEDFYVLKGEEAPSKAWRLKKTVNVFPQRAVVMDGPDSHHTRSGDPVSVDIDWVYVKTPNKGDDSFYLNRIVTRTDGTVLNPARAHLLRDTKVHKEWNGLGLRSRGWLPKPELKPAYGPEAQDLAPYTITEDDLDVMQVSMENGKTLRLHNGHWLIIDEAPAKTKKSKRGPPAATRGTGKAFPSGGRQDEDEAQSLSQG